MEHTQTAEHRPWKNASDWCKGNNVSNRFLHSLCKTALAGYKKEHMFLQMDTSKGIAVADLGGGGATPWPPSYFKANLRPAERGKNIFEASPPSYLRHLMSVAPTYFKIWIRHWIVVINCSKNLLIWVVFSDTDKLY